MNGAADNGPPHVGRSIYKRFGLAALAIIVLSAAATATAGLLQVQDITNIIKDEGHGISGIGSELTAAEAGQPQTILVLGSDKRFIDFRQHNPSRSDTMMLLRLDPNQQATAVMSIPRDLKVDIPLPRGGYATDKINAAYALGGPKTTVKTIKQLLQIPINHVVNVHFEAFERAVNYIGCVYTDVDRKYFNANSPPVGGGGRYATIDIPAGYQKLCGMDSLDYVRFRHLDNDIVRSARQQDFLRAAKEQVVARGLFSLDRIKDLVKIFARYTDTDIRSTSAILRLLKLAIFSAGNPVREVHFQATPGPTYVNANPNQLQTSVQQFLHAKASSGPRPKAGTQTGSLPQRKHRKRTRRRGPIVVAGLVNGRQAGEDQAAAIVAKHAVPFPVYFPTLITAFGHYSTSTPEPRVYDIYDRHHKRHRAYRMVIQQGISSQGQYYGLQAMDWQDPPILDHPSEKRRMRGRTYELHFDGTRLRLVAFRTKRAVYWVSNTLSLALRNDQMLAIARSLQSRFAKK